MSLLPLELWNKLDDSLGQVDLRMSPERVMARLRELVTLQPAAEGAELQSLFVSLAALAMTGAMGCHLRAEAAAKLRWQDPANLAAPSENPSHPAPLSRLMG